MLLVFLISFIDFLNAQNSTNLQKCLANSTSPCTDSIGNILCQPTTTADQIIPGIYI